MEENQSEELTQQPIFRAAIPVGLIVLVLMALSTFNRPQNSPTPEVSGESTTLTSPTTPPEKEYTLQEVSLHAQKTDCWFVIEGKVYDVTGYIATGKHPGKDAIIQGCGKDATDLFNTRPMGSGTPHSDKAREFLNNFLIGVLK